jgi:hypothetical protein
LPPLATMWVLDTVVGIEAFLSCAAA